MLFLIVNLLGTDINKIILNMANETSIHLYNYDDTPLEKSVNHYIGQESQIKEIIIKDSISNNIFYQVYKDNNKLIINKNSNKNKNNFLVIKQNIMYKEKKIGEIIAYCTKTEKITLTQEEKQWIKDNPEIKIAIGAYWYLNDQSQILEVEIIKLINKYMKINIVPTKYNSWESAYNDAIEGKKIHGISRLSWSKAREEKYFKYTPTYNFTPLLLVTKNNNNTIKDIKDIANSSVYIINKTVVSTVLNEISKSTKQILKKGPDELYKALSNSNKNEALLSFIENEEKLKEYNLKVVKKINNKYGEISIGIHKNYPLLASIITKAYKIIPKYELINMSNNNFFYNNKIDLTTDEKQWIKKHKTIKFVADPFWAPFEFLDNNNKYIGIASAYIDLISKRTGLEFKHIGTKSWIESEKKVSSNKADMYSCVTKSDQRERLFNFSKSYLKYSMVMVTTNEKPFLDDITSLYGRTVVAIKGYAFTESIQKNHPKINIIYVNNILEALTTVSSKKAYAMISMLPIASYNINKNSFFNLKIAGKLKDVFALHIAVKKELGITGINIINKALDSITDKEKEIMYNEWVSIKYEKKVNYDIIWKILIISFIILSIILYWNKKLKNEILERKKIEQELNNNKIKLKEKTKKAEVASKSKSEFLANMSHEIRTPMNAVIGFTDLLDKLIKDPIQRGYLNSIQTGGNALMAIINDILDLSKIEAGKFNIEKENIKPVTLFNEMKAIFNEKINQKNLSFVIEIDENLPEVIVIDSVRVRQVLLNIIGNAIKFTNTGKITLKVKSNFINDDETKIDLKIIVTDTGRGIPEKFQKKIFQAFEQTSVADAKVFSGTGLGLAISSKLVKLMNGTIEVESEVQKGSSFIISLFNINVGSFIKEEQTTKIPKVRFNKATILIVDDIFENRYLVKATLANEPFILIEAKNGKEALDIVKNKKNKIDLILMDLRMPIMNGYEATDKVKNIDNNILVVAFTASVMSKELNQIKEHKFDGYIRKPIVYNDLVKELMKHIPYDIIIDKYDKSKNKKIDKETIKKIPEIISKLNGQFKIRLNNIKDKGDFSLIKELMEEISEYEINNKIIILENYVNNILISIESFDIEQVSLLLNNYDAMLKELEKVYEENKNE